MAVILAVFIQVTIFSWNHSKKNGRQEVKIVVNFLKKEILRSNELDLEVKIKDVLAEVPNFKDLSVIIKNDDFFLRKGYIVVKDLERKKRKTMYGLRKFYVDDGTIYDKENNLIQITVIKSLRDDIRFIADITLIFTGIFILLNLICFLLYKYSYKNMISQIKNIESEVNKLDIYGEKFEPIEIKENYYEENKNIIKAANNMLVRLNDQKKQQLDFIHSASHEMRTPLTIMKGYTGMLERWAIEDGNEKVIREYVGVISDTINESTELIEKLLFLVQDDMELNMEMFSLKKLVREVYIKLLVKYPESELVIEGDTYIPTDKVLMKLLLLNLIENAIKYGDNKKIEIEINDDFLSISNYGKHIKEKNLSKIFDRFYREDGSRNNEVEGHGLGLSIVKVISKKLGYEVKIKNKEEIGVISKIIF